MSTERKLRLGVGKCMAVKRSRVQQVDPWVSHQLRKIRERVGGWAESERKAAVCSLCISYIRKYSV